MHGKQCGVVYEPSAETERRMLSFELEVIFSLQSLPSNRR